MKHRVYAFILTISLIFIVTGCKIAEESDERETDSVNVNLSESDIINQAPNATSSIEIDSLTSTNNENTILEATTETGSLKTLSTTTITEETFSESTTDNELKAYEEWLLLGAYNLAKDFLVALNTYDEKVLKTIMMEDFYNEITEFVNLYPTKEELYKAIDEASTIYKEAFLNDETTLKDYSILKLIGNMEYRDYASVINISGIIDYNIQYNIFDEIDIIGMTIRIGADSVGIGKYDYYDQYDQYNYLLNLGFDIFYYKESDVFIIRDFGLTDLLVL